MLQAGKSRGDGWGEGKELQQKSVRASMRALLLDSVLLNCSAEVFRDGSCPGVQHTQCQAAGVWQGRTSAHLNHDTDW